MTQPGAARKVPAPGAAFVWAPINARPTWALRHGGASGLVHGTQGQGQVQGEAAATAQSHRSLVDKHQISNMLISFDVSVCLSYQIQIRKASFKAT